MKKYLSILLLIIFLFSFTGCNKKNLSSSPADNTTSGFIDLDEVTSEENKSDENSSSNTESSKDSDKTDDKNSDNKDSLNNKENNNTVKPNDKTNSNNQDTTTDNDSQNKKPSSDKDNPNNQTDNTNNNDNTDKENDDDKSDDEDKNYKDIECKNVTSWKSIELVSNNNSLYLKVNIPNDWNIGADGVIKIKNTQIGKISTKLNENFTKVYEEIKSSNVISPISASSSVREYTVNNEQKYKRIIKIIKSNSTDNLLNLFISVDYSQLNDTATSKILNSIINNGEYKATPLLNKESTKDILFLGNNNISNSKIDNYLSKLLNLGNKIQKVVTNQPVGGGEVNNFASNTGIISKITNGEFSVVILNGFYTEENTIEPIKTIIEACEKSNTLLILFPAFDDDTDIVDKILSKHQNVYCINWNNEIKKLISTGQNGITTLITTDFYSDSNESSTELSGYVGAHLIYKTIYNENPSVITHDLPENYSKIKDYFQSGIIPGESKSEIFFIP